MSWCRATKEKKIMLHSKPHTNLHDFALFEVRYTEYIYVPIYMKLKKMMAVCSGIHL